MYTKAFSGYFQVYVGQLMVSRRFPLVIVEAGIFMGHLSSQVVEAKISDKSNVHEQLFQMLFPQYGFEKNVIM